METLFDDLFTFVAKPGDPMSFCHLKVVRGTDDALILVTQRVDADNQVVMGYSIAYAADYLATTIVNRFGLDPTRTIYLQHYERTDGSDSGYSLVRFDWTEAEGGGAPTFAASNPRWSEVEASDLSGLFKGEDLSRS